MHRTLRAAFLAPLLAGLLAACGYLTPTIPDVELPGGLFGLGGGVAVDLFADPATFEATAGARNWSGGLALGYPVIGLVGIELPGFLTPVSIVETVALGEVVLVRPVGSAPHSFTLEALELSGGVVIRGVEYPLPEGSIATGLDVPFERGACQAERCTYHAAAEPPEVEVVFTPALLQAFSELLENGGPVLVALQVRAELGAPGSPAQGVMTVHLETRGARIRF